MSRTKLQLDTITWFNRIIASDKTHYLSPENNAGRGTNGALHSREFCALILKDGRGYLFPAGSKRLALKGLEIYHSQNIKARVFKSMLKASIHFGAFKKILPVYSQARISEPADQVANSLFEYLDFSFKPESALAFAVSLGTPAAYRKPVIQILDKKQIIGYAKVGWNAHTLRLVKNEAETLVQLAKVKPASFSVPKLLFQEKWRDLLIAVQSAAPPFGKSVPVKMNDAYAAILKEIAAIHTELKPLRESEFWQQISKRAAEINDATYREFVQTFIQRIDKQRANKPIIFHFSHGDFAPWNIKKTKNDYFIYDWEYAVKNAAAGWDLFHFYTQTQLLLEKQSAGEACEFFKNNSQFRKTAADFLTGFEHSEKDVDFFLALYFLDRLTFYAVDGDTKTAETFKVLAEYMLKSSFA